MLKQQKKKLHLYFVFVQNEYIIMHIPNQDINRIPIGPILSSKIRLEVLTTHGDKECSENGQIGFSEITFNGKTHSPAPDQYDTCMNPKPENNCPPPLREKRQFFQVEKSKRIVNFLRKSQRIIASPRENKSFFHEGG
jgi:hypothetical protein